MTAPGSVRHEDDAESADRGHLVIDRGVGSDAQRVVARNEGSQLPDAEQLFQLAAFGDAGRLTG